MQDFRAEVRELRCLGEGQVRHDARMRNDSRIGGEHPVDVGPDLNLGGIEACAEDCRGIVRAAAPQRRRDAARGRADESPEDGDRSRAQYGRDNLANATLGG